MAQIYRTTQSRRRTANTYMEKFNNSWTRWIIPIVLIYLFLPDFLNKIGDLFKSKDEKEADITDDKQIAKTRKIQKQYDGQDSRTNKKFSLRDEEYKRLADSLYTAMNGVGTNFVVIKSVMAQMRSRDDYEKLQATFGVRKISTGLMSDNFTLSQALVDELDEDQYLELKLFLGKKGINI